MRILMFKKNIVRHVALVNICYVERLAMKMLKLLNKYLKQILRRVKRNLKLKSLLGLNPCLAYENKFCVCSCDLSSFQTYHRNQ